LVFDLPNPHRFPPLAGFTNEESGVLMRYVQSCRELAESTVLSYRTRLAFKSENGKPTVEADEPPREAIRGTVVLFRQISAEDETASYSRVRKIIGRRIHETRDEYADQRNEWQRRWNRTRGSLMSELLTAMADREAIRRMGGAETVPVPGEDVSPAELFSLFQYGDLIHWGDRRHAIGALMADEVIYRLRAFQFLEGVVQLSHFYIGYSVIVRRALDLPTYAGT
jgi:hypothetical protein